MQPLPSALTHLDEVLAEIGDRALAVFLDFDGTLSPIVGDPTRAELPATTRAIVADLAAVVPVALVSGRDRADVQARVGLPGLAYAGSHGFDIVAADGTTLDGDRGTPFLAALDGATAELRATLADVPGVLVDRKRFAVAVHHRHVAPEQVPRVHAEVARLAAAGHGLRRSAGKEVVELRPDLDWDKGRTVHRLLTALGLGDGAAPLFIGDDETDEDAFAAVRARGIGVLVADSPRPTAARYALRDPQEAAAFLRALAAARPLSTG